MNPPAPHTNARFTAVLRERGYQSVESIRAPACVDLAGRGLPPGGAPASCASSSRSCPSLSWPCSTWSTPAALMASMPESRRSSHPFARRYQMWNSTSSRGVRISRATSYSPMPGKRHGPAPLDVEERQHALPRVAVLVEGCAVARLGHQLPLAVPVFLVRGVVAGPGFRVRQDPVRLHELAELLFVGRLRVIRVELLGQVAEDALNRVFVRTRADLEQLVVIDEIRGTHEYLPEPRRRGRGLRRLRLIQVFVAERGCQGVSGSSFRPASAIVPGRPGVDWPQHAGGCTDERSWLPRPGLLASLCRACACVGRTPAPIAAASDGRGGTIPTGHWEMGPC